MIWLALCIVFTSFLIIAFKYFEKYKVVTIPAIAFNYLTCGLMGLIFQQNHEAMFQLHLQPWILYAIALGLLFIVVFYLLGINTQINGITVGAIANKLSVVIPVAIAIYAYNEKVTALKVIGILLALLSVVLSNIKLQKNNSNVVKRNWLLPFVVFIGSGICDSFLNFIQKYHLPEQFNELFIAIVFLTAALAGFVVALYNSLFKNIAFGKKEMIAGFLLGLPNFASIFSILKALQHSGLEHSILWPINNVGIIVFSSVYSVVFFKEKLEPINIFGIMIAVAAIVFMMV
jgi:drug/metabolite transporter (DMT)-like permease